MQIQYNSQNKIASGNLLPARLDDPFVVKSCLSIVSLFAKGLVKLGATGERIVNL